MGIEKYQFIAVGFSQRTPKSRVMALAKIRRHAFR